MLYKLFSKDEFKVTLDGLSNTIFGIFYVGWLMSHLILLRGAYDGKIQIFYILIVTWVGDTTSLYVGRGLGRHRLAPSISPNKTVEGAIAGLIGSLSGGFLAKLWFFGRLSVLDSIITSLLCGIIGQVGDLCESAIKRGVNEKDAGNIIPGHGGILDRMDSLLFSSPAFYYYTKLFL
jgi:phosphatidate cytidylyltransferase